MNTYARIHVELGLSLGRWEYLPQIIGMILSLIRHDGGSSIAVSRATRSINIPDAIGKSRSTLSLR